MDESDSILIGAPEGGAPLRLPLNRANRHGLIAGATGTGKTVTLQGLAEGFSAAGVPVFVADVKGDLAGLAMPGSAGHPAHAPLAARAAELGIGDFAYRDFPAVFWDLLGEQGHPVRTTVSEMGPLLLARLMGLNETQEGVLSIAFKVADEQGLLLLDLEDLQAMLAWCAANAATLSAEYGNVTKPSVGAIQRQLLQLEAEDGGRFFGEPALDIADLMLTAEDGRGMISILAADKLMARPRLYSTFLLWLLSELFEALPEVGDPLKPKLVFFFDEAHLLFADAPPALVEKVEQVVRLIRSKGVGVYFITQNPADIPEAVAGQLGNRVQHALRAFTPKDQKAIKGAAATFRASEGLNVETAITELRTGEALVSLLQPDGAPSPVSRALIRPPSARLGPLSAKERAIIQSLSPVADKYDTAVDRDSAEEMLKSRADASAAEAQRLKDEEQAAKDRAAAEKEAEKARKEAEKAAEKTRKEEEKTRKEAERAAEKARKEAEREAARAERERRANPPLHEELAGQFARTVQRQVVNRAAGSLVRGILGGLFGGRR